MIQDVLKQPMNRLVNEAVRIYVAQRTSEIEGNLQQVLDRLRAYRRADPQFKQAIAEFAEAEAAYGATDPVDGRVVPAPGKGPAQTMVQELLRG